MARPMQEAAKVCAVVIPAEEIRDEVIRALGSAGLTGVLSSPDPATFGRDIEGTATLDVAVIGVPRDDRPSLDLLAHLRTGRPECLVFALDMADVDDSAARAFEAGAHDVLRMPFRPAEFEARLVRGLPVQAGAARGRYNGHEPAPTASLDAAGALELTPIEARILDILTRHQGEIVTRNELSQRLYGVDWAYGDRRFDVHVTRIRRKLRDAPELGVAVRTIRSVGYMLERAGAAAPI